MIPFLLCGMLCPFFIFLKICEGRQAVPLSNCKFAVHFEQPNQPSYVDYLIENYFSGENCKLERLKYRSRAFFQPSLPILSRISQRPEVFLPATKNRSTKVILRNADGLASLRVFAKYAAEIGITSVAIITDNFEKSFDMFGLGNKVKIVISAWIFDDDKLSSVTNMLQANQDVAFVDCSTPLCLNFFEKILIRADFQKNFTFFLNEHVTFKFSLDIAEGLSSFPLFGKRIRLIGIRKFYTNLELLKQLDSFVTSTSNCKIFSNERCAMIRQENLKLIILLYEALDLIKAFCQEEGDWKINGVRLFDNSAVISWNKKSYAAKFHNAYELLKLSFQKSFDKIGTFHDGSVILQDSGDHPKRRLRKAITSKCSPAPFDPKMSRRHFKITTIEEPPFLIVDPDNLYRGSHHGNLTGLIVEMMEELAKILNITYTMKLVPDGKYGSIEVDENGFPSASGMVRQILQCESDLAAAAMSITEERLKYISFATPWMNYGLILYRQKLTPKNPKLFAFLDPFDGVLWGIILVCLAGMSILLAVLRCILPADSNNDQQLRWRQQTFANSTNPSSCFVNFGISSWLLYATAMQQEPDYVRRPSGMILLGGWFLFSLIIISTYTANLTAFLTLQAIPSTIESIDDLAEQTQVPFGTVNNSAISDFFFNSYIPVYRKIGDYMRANPSSMVETAAEGLDRALRSDYVFIWDSNVLDYWSTSDPCRTETVGRAFDNRGYGLAMPQGMPYLRNFSLAILKMKDDGSMAELRAKWLNHGDCLAAASTSIFSGGESVPKIGIWHLAGVVLVLCVAAVLAVIVACFERWCWSIKKRRKVELARDVESTGDNSSSRFALREERGQAYSEFAYKSDSGADIVQETA